MSMYKTDEQLCQKYRAMLKGYTEGKIEDGLGRKPNFNYSDISSYNVYFDKRWITQGVTVNRQIGVYVFSITLKNGEIKSLEKHNYDDIRQQVLG